MTRCSPQQGGSAGSCMAGSGSRAFTFGHGIAGQQRNTLKGLASGIASGSPSTTRSRSTERPSWRRSFGTCTTTLCAEDWCNRQRSGSGVRLAGTSGDDQSVSLSSGWNDLPQPLMAKPHRFKNRCHPRVYQSCRYCIRKYLDRTVCHPFLSFLPVSNMSFRMSIVALSSPAPARMASCFRSCLNCGPSVLQNIDDY